MTLNDFFIEQNATFEQQEKFEKILQERLNDDNYRGTMMTYEDLQVLWVRKMYKDKPIIAYCFCGKPISNDNVEYANKCNEEGEDYYEGQAHCICGKEFYWNEWGWCESISDAITDLKNHIDNGNEFNFRR